MTPPPPAAPATTRRRSPPNRRRSPPNRHKSLINVVQTVQPLENAIASLPIRNRSALAATCKAARAIIKKGTLPMPLRVPGRPAATTLFGGFPKASEYEPVIDPARVDEAFSIRRRDGDAAKVTAAFERLAAAARVFVPGIKNATHGLTKEYHIHDDDYGHALSVDDDMRTRLATLMRRVARIQVPRGVTVSFGHERNFWWGQQTRPTYVTADDFAGEFIYVILETRTPPMVGDHMTMYYLIPLVRLTCNKEDTNEEEDDEVILRASFPDLQEFTAEGRVTAWFEWCAFHVIVNNQYDLYKPDDKLVVWSVRQLNPVNPPLHRRTLNNRAHVIAYAVIILMIGFACKAAFKISLRFEEFDTPADASVRVLLDRLLLKSANYREALRLHSWYTL